VDRLVQYEDIDIDEDKVLKEVWNVEDIDAKTELDSFQIETVNKLKTMAEIFNSSLLEKHVTRFEVLQKSKNRASMREFVDVVRAKREDFVQKGKGFFNNMMG